MTHYCAVEGVSLPDLVAALREAFTGRTLSPEAFPPLRFDRRYLDTADGLFLRRGLVLVHAGTGAGAGGGHMILQGAASGEQVAAFRPARCPRFATDLPSGPFAARIAAIAGYRALLPYASLKGTEVEIALRNEEDKTVVRMRLSDASLGGRPRSRRQPFGLRVEIEAVRGYDEAAAMVEQALSRLPQVRAVKGGVHAALLAALGTWPGAAFPRGPVLFPPDLPATAACRLILERLLVVLEVNERGVRDDIDTEFLHDYRIAVRRARTMISTMKKVLPQDFVTLRNDLRWLGQITGPARDLDVYLLEFSNISAAIPERERPGLAPMHALLVKKRAAAYRALGRALKSERYQRIKQRWHGILQLDAREDAPTRPIAVEAGRRIIRFYRLAVREGRAISGESPPEMLHELRKTCKKLRYLIEFFAHLYPEKQVRQRIKELKQIQNNLGLYQDAHVQHDFVEHLLAELEAAGPVAPGTGRAMRHLAAQRLTLQDRARKRFARTFAAFAPPDGVDSYRSLFETVAGDRSEKPLAKGVTE